MRAHPWLALPVGFLALAACPEQEAQDDAPGFTFELPDRYRAKPSSMALRLTNAAPSDPVVKDDLSALLTQELKLVDVVQRGYAGGDVDVDGDTDPYTQTAAHQTLALLQSLNDRGAGLPAEPPVDACGNPVIASFLTPDTLTDLISDAGPWADGLLADLLPTAASGADCEHGCEGVFDVVLTEPRADGSVDAIIGLYPEIREDGAGGETWNPGWMGQFVGFFHSRNAPGLWQVPFVTLMEKVQVSVQSVLRREHAEVDSVFLEGHNYYVFPHGAREVSRSHIGVSFLADDLCDTHYDAVYGPLGGATPFGCKLPSGLNLSTPLELTSQVGSDLYFGLLEAGDRTDPINQVSETLAYTIGSQIACPTIEEDRWVQRGVAELFLCGSAFEAIDQSEAFSADKALDQCIARRDRDRYGCAMDDETLFPPVERTVSGSSTFGPSATTYELSVPVGGKGGFSNPAVTLTLEGERDGTMMLYSPSASRFTSSTATLTPVTGSDLWCTSGEVGGLQAVEVELDGNGRAVLNVNLSSPVQVMFNDAQRSYLAP